MIGNRFGLVVLPQQVVILYSVYDCNQRPARICCDWAIPAGGELLPVAGGRWRSIPPSAFLISRLQTAKLQLNIEAIIIHAMKLAGWKIGRAAGYCV